MRYELKFCSDCMARTVHEDYECVRHREIQKVLTDKVEFRKALLLARDSVTSFPLWDAYKARN